MLPNLPAQALTLPATLWDCQLRRVCHHSQTAVAVQPSPLVAGQQRQRCLRQRIRLRWHLVLLWWEVLMTTGDAQPWVQLGGLRLQCSTCMGTFACSAAHAWGPAPAVQHMLGSLRLPCRASLPVPAVRHMLSKPSKTGPVTL